MFRKSIVQCGILNCPCCARNSTVVGVQRFCVIPVMTKITTMHKSLLRYNLCETHLRDLRSNFKEIYHDRTRADYGDVAMYV